MTTREEFISTIAPIAVKLRLEGSPIFPSVRIAQAILETGGVLNSWNNLVGYKVGDGQKTEYWDGSAISKTTWEVYDDTRYDNVRADFRVYDSIEDGFRDQDLLFQAARYTGVREAASPSEQTKALQSGGYATDPDYATKLDSLIKSYNLTQYDEEVTRMLEQLTAQLADLQNRVNVLEASASMEAVPEWAQEAVNAAVAAGLIDTPQGGSYDFYRLLTVLHRKGIV